MIYYMTDGCNDICGDVTGYNIMKYSGISWDN
jgi:hypothetical protein